MSDQNVNTNKSKNKRRNSAKDADVTCWNCFTSEDYDNDLEPVTLPKVRQENREKLKVYSFLASELSKPKTVSLKQKVSEHYSVGKKIDEKLKKTQANVPELSRTIEEISKKDESTKSSILEKNTPEKKIIDKIEPYFINREIKDNLVPEDVTDDGASLNLVRKESLSKVILEPPSSFSNASQCLNTETKHHQVNISNVSEKNSTDILPTRTNSEDFGADQLIKKLSLNTDSKDENKNTSVTSLENEKIVAEISQPLKSDKTSNKSNIPIRSPKLLPKTEKNEFIVTKIPVLQKQTSPKYSPIKIFRDKSKDQSVGKNNFTPESKIPVKEKTSVSLNNSKETNESMNEVFVKKYDDKNKIDMLPSGTSLTDYKSSEEQTTDQDANVKIVHRVQIKTSTPKDKEIQKNIFHGEISIPSVQTREDCDMKKDVDKSDNSSSNFSESGYAGSSSTVQDFCVNENIIKNQILDAKNTDKTLINQKIAGTKNINSSLPVLDTHNKKQLRTSTTSLFAGNEQAKSMRSRTLPVAPRSVSFEGTHYK
ncbi:unnamed protein product [Euphydryas editha]|uniref:Uncharacterized protein n=1 Tax=Euphydryas editha TaxID=104508 RepID=A0AAU9V5X5_EUPED|nr:unnamed protein product [Euphydryas editha]